MFIGKCAEKRFFQALRIFHFSWATREEIPFIRAIRCIPPKIRNGLPAHYKEALDTQVLPLDSQSRVTLILFDRLCYNRTISAVSVTIWSTCTEITSRFRQLLSIGLCSFSSTRQNSLYRVQTSRLRPNDSANGICSQRIFGHTRLDTITQY